MSASFSQYKNKSMPARRKGMRYQLGVSLVLASFLAACSGANIEADYPDKGNNATEESGSLFDNFSFGLLNKDAAENTAASTPNTPSRGLGVNAILWRATLDTLSFLPIASTDPIGGVVITDWYNDPATPNERLKINVVIQGLELRADALSVSLFREARINDRWASIAGSRTTERQLENIILIRARDYKMASQPAE